MTKLTKSMFVIVALSLLALSANAEESPAKTESVTSIAVYYESLCPDSIAFITKQLYPAYEKLSSYLKIDLVPFGKASLIGTNFTCRHGTGECTLDKAHACVINDKSLNQSVVLKFVNCTMATFTKYSSIESAKQCANTSGIIYDNIFSCYNNETLVIKYIGEFYNKTEALNPKLTNVPLVVVDGKQEESAEKNFKSVVCKYLSSLGLDYCKEPNSAAGTVAATFIIVFIAAFVAKLA